MATATKTRSAKKPTLRGLSAEVARLRSRVTELEDLRDLNAAVAQNAGKPGVKWEQAKVALGLG